MVNEKIIGVVDSLDSMKLDNSVPKNIRFKIGEAIGCLNDGTCNDTSLKLNKLLNQLEDITEDPKIPSYVRIELLNVIGILENTI